MDNSNKWLCPQCNTWNEGPICIIDGYAKPSQSPTIPQDPTSPPPDRNWKLIAIFSIGVLIVFITVAAILNNNLPPSPPPTSIAGITQVVTAVTSIAPTSTPVATAVPLDEEANKALVFGPGEGDLLMKDRLQIDSPQKTIELENFSTEVTFTNPYSGATDAKWDYGIIFRNSGQKQLFLLIRSDNKWAVVREEGAELSISSQGSIANLRTDEGETNVVKLVCKGEKGWLYMNRELIRTFDLPSGFGSGAIAVGTGFFQEDRINGKTTHYSDWKIWSLE